MINLMFAAISNELLLPLILLVIIVGSLGFAFYKKMRYKNEVNSLYEELKVGDKVKTFSGIYGEVVSIREALDGSMVIDLKTGENGKETYITMDMGAVFNLDIKDEEFVEDDAKEIEETKTTEKVEVTVEVEKQKKAKKPTEKAKVEVAKEDETPKPKKKTVKKAEA